MPKVVSVLANEVLKPRKSFFPFRNPFEFKASPVLVVAFRVRKSVFDRFPVCCSRSIIDKTRLLSEELERLSRVNELSGSIVAPILSTILTSSGAFLSFSVKHFLIFCISRSHCRKGE